MIKHTDFDQFVLACLGPPLNEIDQSRALRFDLIEKKTHIVWPGHAPKLTAYFIVKSKGKSLRFEYKILTNTFNEMTYAGFQCKSRNYMIPIDGIMYWAPYLGCDEEELRDFLQIIRRKLIVGMNTFLSEYQNFRRNRMNE